MFGSKALSLPSPFAHDHRSQQLFSEPARPQPTGQCHFLIQHTGSKEHRCACQGYQHNRNVSVNGTIMVHDTYMNNAPTSSSLLDRLRKLEEAVEKERHNRENILARERQTLEREIRVLREALTPFYKTEEEMRQKLAEIERRLDETVKEQTRINQRFSDIDNENVTFIRRGPTSITNSSDAFAGQRLKSSLNGLGSHEALALYSGSEGRVSPVSTDPMSPKHSANIVAESESPRSSGILNLVELPRPALPRYNMPPRLSPPAEPDEPRSSGFLALDVKELIQRRKLVNKFPPAPPYGSPSNSATKSPPSLTSNSTTPQSLPRVSPPKGHLHGSLIDTGNRIHKKRKHQAELMALDVLADVSAASPVMP